MGSQNLMELQHEIVIWTWSEFTIFKYELWFWIQKSSFLFIAEESLTLFPTVLCYLNYFIQIDYTFARKPITILYKLYKRFLVLAASMGKRNLFHKNNLSINDFAYFVHQWFMHFQKLWSLNQVCGYKEGTVKNYNQQNSICAHLKLIRYSIFHTLHDSLWPLFSNVNVIVISH